MQIDKQINVQDEWVKAKQNKLQITNYKSKKDAGRTGRRKPTNTYTAEVLWGIYPKRDDGEAECKSGARAKMLTDLDAFSRRRGAVYTALSVSPDPAGGEEQVVPKWASAFAGLSVNNWNDYWKDTAWRSMQQMLNPMSSWCLLSS